MADVDLETVSDFKARVRLETDLKSGPLSLALGSFLVGLGFASLAFISVLQKASILLLAGLGGLVVVGILTAIKGASLIREREKYAEISGVRVEKPKFGDKK